MPDENITIPRPITSGATDQPNAPQSGTPEAPPVPAGFTDTPPSPPVPAGFSDERPESAPAKSEDQSGLVNPMAQSGLDLLKGIGKGVESTTAGVGDFLRKGMDVASSISPQKALESLGLAQKGSTDKTAEQAKELLVPKAGLEAEKQQAVPHGLSQMVGYGGETLTEFLLGDEALKGMSLADKLANAGKVAKIFEQSPRLMKALQMGADVSKAAGELTSEAQQAIKNSPMLARLVGAGMDAIRQGTVQAAQTGVRSGGDVKKAAAEGGTTAAASGVLGGAFGMLGRAAEKAGEAGTAVKTASEFGAAAPSKAEISKGVASQIQKADAAMHGDFEQGIQSLKGKLGDTTVPYKGSPLQKAAKATLEGITDKQTIPGKEEVSSILDEAGKPIVKPGEPKIIRTTKGALPEFGSLAGGSPESKNILMSLTDEKKAGDLNIDELVQRRQQLGEKIGQLTKGATSSTDRADVAVYQKLRDGIDQTIDQLAKSSGSPEASQDYSALRNAYKAKVNLFKEPVIKAMQEGDLDNAGKYLLSGGKTLDKINTLEQVIGKDGIKDFGQNIAHSMMADATSESGKINPAKFVKDWKRIDALPPEVKTRLFDMTGASDGLDKLSKDMKSAANYQKLVRGGILGSTGALTHGWGLALGLLGHGDFGRATEVLDMVANRPSMWSAFRTAGKVGAKAEASPAARRAIGAAAYGTGNALSNILQGAEEPLSQPDQDQESQ